MQVATNRVHNAQIYAKKFIVYAKFLDAVQRFVRQYNILLLHLTYFYPAFFTG